MSIKYSNLTPIIYQYTTIKLNNTVTGHTTPNKATLTGHTTPNKVIVTGHTTPNKVTVTGKKILTKQCFIENKIYIKI